MLEELHKKEFIIHGEHHGRKEFEILWEKIRKIDKNMADLFDERVELTRRTAISKIEASIPVYDAKGEEKNVEDAVGLASENVKPIPFH